MDWSDKSVLVTGGTGSFGKMFVRQLLHIQKPRRIIVFSRDELKQHEMRQTLDDESLRYFIGDVRDKDRLYRAFNGVDIVVHAAALKQVPACEYNPIEAIMTNVMGARNIIDAALDNGVSKVLALSTDKAVNPINLYGATKLCAEKLFIHANAYSRADETAFSNVRYGNVIGSRGSVIPLFRQQRDAGELTITHKDMTRFWITLEQGVDFVISCIERMHGGEVFVPKIPSMNIMDLAQAIAPGTPVTFTGIRSGEKMHEVLISEDEARHTRDAGDRYVVLPDQHEWWITSPDAIGQALTDEFSYTSRNNDEWLTIAQLQDLANRV
ncbi:MAG: UDP-N-acetylglucosamine 4,6-dehydratase (inverting) [Anaerolineales bacterium]